MPLYDAAIIIAQPSIEFTQKVFDDYKTKSATCCFRL